MNRGDAIEFPDPFRHLLLELLGVRDLVQEPGLIELA